MNIHALFARHCGPHSSSIKLSILNWHDQMFQPAVSYKMADGLDGSGHNVVVRNENGGRLVMHRNVP